MTKRLIKNSPYWETARNLLSNWLDGRAEVGLAEAQGALNGAVTSIAMGFGSDVAKKEAFLAEVLDGEAGSDAVSRLLRSLGYRKAGMKGSALTCDRQPLYARSAEQSEARGGATQ